MMATSPTETLGKLKQAARERWNSNQAGKTRVVVQVGHCSQAVGAREVSDSLASSLPDNAYLTIAGCDGACFAAPQVLISTGDGGRTRIAHARPEATVAHLSGAPNGAEVADGQAQAFFERQRRVSLNRCGELDSTDAGDYILAGGYAGLARALSMPPEEVIEEVKASGLRGRGGAYFPAALKWEGARKVEAESRYLVVNSEEGEPGVFKDRHLMEGVPHRILEGAIIAGYASGVKRAYIYINAEANLSAERVQKAVDDAAELGLVGDHILGSGYSLNVEILRGAGGYVCGEETTILNTLEGYRREPRLRPPFPTEAGLWAKPTIINNAETLANVPFILANGAAAFSKIGKGEASGTKIVSLSGSVQRPGVAEVPLGTTLREIITDIGGGPPAGHTLIGVAVGGPSSGVFPTSMLDTPIAPGRLHDTGIMLGAGGVIALDERSNVLDVVRRLAAYNAKESCGKCTPCREGTPRIVDAIDRLISGSGSSGDLDELRYLSEVVSLASLCGLGQAAGTPINSALHFFGDEMAALATSS